MALLWLALLVAVIQSVVAAPQKVKRQADQVRMDLNSNLSFLVIWLQEPLQCRDYSDSGFYCVPSYQCNDDFVIKTDAGGLFDVRCVIYAIKAICTRGADDCPIDPEYFEPGCCPPDRNTALTSRCRATLAVCCLHPNRSETGLFNRFNIPPSTDQYKPEKLITNCGEEGGENPDYEIIEPTDPDADIFGSNEPDEPLECDPLFGCDAPKCECSEDDAIFGICEPCDTKPVPPSPGPVTEPIVPPTTNRGPACGYRNPSGAASVPVRNIFKIVK